MQVECFYSKGGGKVYFVTSKISYERKKIRFQEKNKTVLKTENFCTMFVKLIIASAVVWCLQN